MNYEDRDDYQERSSRELAAQDAGTFAVLAIWIAACIAIAIA